ncbi:MAG TPA: response regulator transcription factor [Candidatus Yaniella excrementigallinarum]|nr:response regulator transcription factor [Candidatus Yaniella excrementigallinarum]
MRVIIAEDNALLREGLVTVLAKFDITVVNAVDTADGLFEAVQAMRDIDVIITDIRMPPTFTTEGLEAAVRLREEYPRLPVLVLSQFVEQFYARELIASGDGAVGYLLKDRVLAVAEFVDAVRRVAAGGTVLDPQVITGLLERADGPRERLSPREQEVMELMAQGRSNTAIAQALFVTEKAVSKHVTSIFAKLDLHQESNDNRRVLAVLRYLQNQ